MRGMIETRFAWLRRALLVVTDLGFAAYWVLTLGHLLPPAWLFRDYADTTMGAWNFSFLPLDMVVSISGLASVALAKTCAGASRILLLVSLVTTSVSGLQALSFWTLRHDFDLGWWAPNLFLLVWPLPFLATMAWRAPADYLVQSGDLGRSAST